ncbi:MAG TPA: sigma-70 family RNA polymerase sigma factor [Bryobacteraceae bacterium]|nr:sigma-70 family RNA polymerase sigma factor [Bryobacteraceae bacterium]
MVQEIREAREEPDESQDVTLLLAEWQKGDQRALDRLMPLVYDQLRRIAARYLHSERSGHTLQTTALVHEAYLRLVGENRIQWQGRTHFFGVAATLIRNILVDHARTQKALKRGAGIGKLSLDEAFAVPAENNAAILAVDDALRALSKIDPQQGRIVELRFFGGLTIEETAELLQISPSTVKRDWILAKTWIYRALSSSAIES